jgi:hypothetical protein
MSQPTWDRLAELAAADDHVAGLVLTGGRGKGVATALSDWDGVLVVTDEGMPRWSTYDFEDLDMTVISEADFVDYAEPETAFSWRAYDFAHLHPVVDRRGFSARLETKGRLTEARAKQLAEEYFGAALNSLYRAAKNHRDGDETAALLDLCEMGSYYLTAVFALDGRLRPYNKLLRWDLERAPLVRVPLSAERLIALLTDALRETDLAAAWSLAERAARGFRNAGLTEVLDDWEGHLLAVRPGWPTAVGGVTRRLRPDG